MMKTVQFRCPEELLTEMNRLAVLEGVSVGQLVRRYCEQATGIQVEVKMGLAGADERTREAVEKARQKGVKRARRNGTAPDSTPSSKPARKRSQATAK